jgi:hypothetical protein
MNSEIASYHAKLEEEDFKICEDLFRLIEDHLPKAESKVWHGHPVWFIDGNPVVGYSKRKNEISLLFWSGQSFDEPYLKATGKFKAAELHFHVLSDINPTLLASCFKKASEIQWNYKNIVKRKGVLERLF